MPCFKITELDAHGAPLGERYYDASNELDALKQYALELSDGGMKPAPSVRCVPHRPDVLPDREWWDGG
jgi:hypothetical protein